MSLIGGDHVDRLEILCKEKDPDQYAAVARLPAIAWPKPLRVFVTAGDVDRGHAGAALVERLRSWNFECSGIPPDGGRDPRWLEAMAQSTVLVVIITPELLAEFDRGEARDAYLQMIAALRRGMRIVPVYVRVNPADLRNPADRPFASYNHVMMGIGRYYGGALHAGCSDTEGAFSQCVHFLRVMKEQWAEK